MTTIRMKWKTRGTDRDMNYYRTRRDKRLFDVFGGEQGMLKSVSWAMIPAGGNI